MKKLFIYVSFSLTLLTISECTKKDITVPAYGSITANTFYKTDADISSALTSTYQQLRQSTNEFAKFNFFINDCTTDDAWKGGANDADNKDLQDLSTFNALTNNGVVLSQWKILYSCIAAANAVITYGPSAGGNTTLIARYILEAKLLRAYCYFNLATAWGSVPLVLSPLTPAQTTAVPKSSADQVFAQAISDLNDATALPAKGTYASADQYRVTNGLAYAILGKIYMFQQNYPKAELAFQNVIQSGKYNLLSDYGANWRTNNSSESMFEMYNTLTSDIGLQTGTQVVRYFTNRLTTNYSGYGFHCPTKDLFNEFDADDPRITYTFTMTGDSFLQDVQAQDNSAAPDRYYDRKIFVPYYQRIGLNLYTVPKNIILERYADIVLLYAEALNENGKPGQALTYLNMIRQRARATAPLDPQRQVQAYIPATNAGSLPNVTTTDQVQLRLAIWHERRCELGMEGYRRYDLLRQKRFGTVIRAFSTKYNNVKGIGFMDNRDYLLPIPQTDIDYSNGVITQNPGY